MNAVRRPSLLPGFLAVARAQLYQIGCKARAVSIGARSDVCPVRNDPVYSVSDSRSALTAGMLGADAVANAARAAALNRPSACFGDGNFDHWISGLGRSRSSTECDSDVNGNGFVGSLSRQLNDASSRCIVDGRVSCMRSMNLAFLRT